MCAIDVRGAAVVAIAAIGSGGRGIEVGVCRWVAVACILISAYSATLCWRPSGLFVGWFGEGRSWCCECGKGGIVESL